MSKSQSVFFFFLLSILMSFCILFLTTTANLLLVISILFISLVLFFANIGDNAFNDILTPPFLIVMFALFIASQSIIESTGNNIIDEALFVPLIFCAIISSRYNPFGFLAKTDTKTLWIFLLFFFISGTISTIFNKVPSVIALKGVLLILKPMIIFIIFLSFSFTRKSTTSFYRQLRFFFLFLCIGSLIWTLLFEIYFQTNPAPGISTSVDQYLGFHSYRSFFRHPGSYSSVMIISCCYFFSLSLIKNRKTDVLLFFISTFCLLSTFRIKVIILLPVCCTFILILAVINEGKLKYRDLSVKLFSIVTLGVLLFSFSIYFSKDKILYYYSSQNVRKAVFLTSIRISLDNYGFGSGFGRYGSAVSTKYYSPLYYKYRLSNLYGATPDNPGFITDQWWGWFIGESGIFGLLFFLGAMFVIIRRIVKASKSNHSRDPDFQVMAYTAIGGLIYGVGSGFASAGLSSPPSSYLIMGLSALAINLYHSSKSSIHLLKIPGTSP